MHRQAQTAAFFNQHTGTSLVPVCARDHEAHVVHAPVSQQALGQLSCSVCGLENKSQLISVRTLTNPANPSARPHLGTQQAPSSAGADLLAACPASSPGGSPRPPSSGRT